MARHPVIFPAESLAKQRATYPMGNSCICAFLLAPRQLSPIVSIATGGSRDSRLPAESLRHY